VVEVSVWCEVFQNGVCWVLFLILAGHKMWRRYVGEVIVGAKTHEAG
jgi:hypothetical protein